MEGFTGCRNATVFEVGTNHGERTGSPCASHGVSSGVGVGRFGAGKVGHSERGIFLGISGIGGEGHLGRVQGPNSDAALHSLDPHVVGSSGGEALESVAIFDGGNRGDLGGERVLDVHAVQVEAESGGVRPEGAQNGDLVGASVSSDDGGRGLRIGHGGSSGLGDGGRARSGDGASVGSRVGQRLSSGLSSRNSGGSRDGVRDGSRDGLRS